MFLFNIKACDILNIVIIHLIIIIIFAKQLQISCDVFSLAFVKNPFRKVVGDLLHEGTFVHSLLY